MTPKYNGQWAIEQYEKSLNQTYLFFWGHRKPAKGSVSKSCLSQWFASPFEVDGFTYQNCEQWMMAHKAKEFNDAIILEKILATSDPNLIKNWDAILKILNKRLGIKSNLILL
jgi:ribA/ribD-fused uncharacterized protein